ncbi:hemerythrin domain-containing protein [Nonomuraea sp. NN258]|uniref:hemerythrin domain-containing protein n=1 Tax=Nonomuraea antri TaxID=2730852 RepID=UPI0015692C44|nr:hemerythrin domain-containing protein [Nonomuraea antri]NRQ39529.1 hemerythrin domain-containing protein [Nonomuraea antri]
MKDTDVVDLLLRQHEEIKALFSEVENAAPEDRAEPFRRLVRLLAVHETAEEEIVHPYARRKLGDDVVDERLAEENSAKDMLTQMERAGVDDPQFAANLATLRKAVVEHAEAEEREEFPRLRQEAGDRERLAMAVGVKAAEALAPTHPHAGVETAPKNLLVGTPVAIMDRARDVIRKAMGKPG